MKACAECRFWWRDEDLPEGDDFSWGFCRPVPHMSRNERADNMSECFYFKPREGGAGIKLGERRVQS